MPMLASPGVQVGDEGLQRFPNGKRRACVAHKCAVCGALFWVPICNARQGEGKYCSLACLGRTSAGRKASCGRSGNLNANWKGGIAQDSAAYARRYEQRHPDAHKAHRALKRALAAGKVVKGRCEVCGREDGIHGHHDDYSKPLSVRWLCGEHHRMVHGASC